MRQSEVCRTGWMVLSDLIVTARMQRLRAGRRAPHTGRENVQRAAAVPRSAGLNKCGRCRRGDAPCRGSLFLLRDERCFRVRVCDTDFLLPLLLPAPPPPSSSFITPVLLDANKSINMIGNRIFTFPSSSRLLPSASLMSR